MEAAPVPPPGFLPASHLLGCKPVLLMYMSHQVAISQTKRESEQDFASHCQLESILYAF